MAKGEPANPLNLAVGFGRVKIAEYLIANYAQLLGAVLNQIYDYRSYAYAGDDDGIDREASQSESEYLYRNAVRMWVEKPDNESVTTWQT